MKSMNNHTTAHMATIKCAAIIQFGLLAILHSHSALANDWVEIANTTVGKYYAPKKASYQRIGDDILATFRHTLTLSTATEMATYENDTRKAYGKPLISPDQIKYIETVEQINCKNSTMDTRELTMIGEKDTIISSAKYKQIDMQRPFGDIGKLQLDYACTHRN